MEKLIERTINATIVLAAGTFAITKLLTIDSDYWHVSSFQLLSLIFAVYNLKHCQLDQFDTHNSYFLPRYKTHSTFLDNNSKKKANWGN